MTQSCTINISRATAIACSAQYMRQGVQSSGEDLFLRDKTINPGKFLLIFALAGDSVFSYTIHSAQPIESVHESCFCFAVVSKDLKCNLVRAGHRFHTGLYGGFNCSIMELMLNCFD